MKFLAITLLMTMVSNICCAAEIPITSFAPGGDGNSKYDYIGSETPFPVLRGSYYYSNNDKLRFLFPKKPEDINLFYEIGGKDPLEGFNRVSFSVTDFFVRWVFRPIGVAYCTIMPRPAIKAINNITNNVAFPKRFLSCLLQAKFTDGGLSLTRFMINTTLGAGGIWDASDYFFELKERDEDFGQAFASWGIGAGCYVFVPGVGPCNLRNGIGKIFDNAVDIKSYVYGGQAASRFHQMLANYEDYDMLVQSSADPYRMIKNFWYVQRMNKVKDRKLEIEIAQNNKNKVRRTLSSQKLDYVKMDLYGSQGVEIDTLKAMFFDVQKEKKSFWTYLSLFNTDFVNQGCSYSIRLYENKDKMTYCFWKQKKNPQAPLILIIPGLGAHHRDSKVMALAELLHAKGFAVAATSSSFNWYFMETAASVDAPGFLPADAGDVRNAWAKIIPQIKEKAGIKPRRIIMLGYSMGAIQALYIAKLEEQRNTLGVDRYLAINPPVDLIYGMDQLDSYFNIYKKWSKAEFVRRGTVAFGKMMKIAKKQYRWYNPANQAGNEDACRQLTIDKDNAELLIGYAFKMTLQQIVMSMHRRGRLTGLKTRYRWNNKAEIYNEILKMSFRDYLKQILYPDYKGRFGKNISLKEFIEKFSYASTMESFKDHLVDNPDIRIIHTMDDFLVRDTGRRWLKETFDEKVVFFEHGGHLGNLYFHKVHKRIFDFLRETPVASPEQQRYYGKHYASLAAPYSVPSIPPGSSEFHNPR